MRPTVPPSIGIRPAGLALALAMAAATASVAGDGDAAPTPAPKPAAKPGPTLRVVSKDRAEQNASPFLRPPGTSRYDRDGEDWRDVPPWRQASFFGLRARGQFFVYVVDCSGSMEDDARLDTAKSELRRSVAALRDPQRFHVIFYNDLPIPMPGGLPVTAGLDAWSRFFAWLDLIEPDGDTDPRGALWQAMALRPDAIFLLSDGAFPEGTAEAVARRNTRKVPIHCVDLGGGLGGDHLARIARDSGGKLLSRPTFGP